MFRIPRGALLDEVFFRPILHEEMLREEMSHEEIEEALISDRIDCTRGRTNRLYS